MSIQSEFEALQKVMTKLEVHEKRTCEQLVICNCVGCFLYSVSSFEVKTFPARFSLSTLVLDKLEVGKEYFVCVKSKNKAGSSKSGGPNFVKLPPGNTCTSIVLFSQKE